MAYRVEVARMRFRILGGLDIVVDQEQLSVPGRREQRALATLLIDRDRVVPTQRLIDAIWENTPPVNADKQVSNVIYRLRRVLTTHGITVQPTAAPGGYRLSLATEQLDAALFHTALARAHDQAAAGKLDDALDTLHGALTLWRGPALTGLGGAVLDAAATSLNEQRLTAQVTYYSHLLALGRHDQATTGLTDLVAHHPTREDLVTLLMTAHYRSGRQSDALNLYTATRRRLITEIGVEPGQPLRDLHQRVLTNAPDLAPPSATPHHNGTPAHTPATPHQLPAAVRHFTGRHTQLATLSDLITHTRTGTTVVISAIHGTAGIGKTALAVHWAHHHRDDFPDGQLYLDLRGFDPDNEPVPTATALRRLLTALGVPTHHIPTDPDEQAALYRTHLAHRRMLILLDNARDTAHVRPLLPGSPGSLVLITSRNQLASLIALDGAVPITLDLLTPTEARQLLFDTLGRATATDEDSITELIDLCARLPLALRIAAAHATLHPERTLRQLVHDLRDARRRLDTLAIGDTAADIRAVFSCSYRTLTPAAAHTFRLLGLHPGTDIGLTAAASLTGRDTDSTRHALDELANAHLITEHAPGRYTFHDLLRAYATEQAQTRTERHDALQRVFDFYVHTAHSANRILNPHAQPIPLDPPGHGVHSVPLADAQTALSWLDAEHPVLLAVQQAAAHHDRHLTVWQLAWALHTFQARRGYSHDRLAVWRAALDAATHLTDPNLHMDAHRYLGIAYAELERHEEGIAHLHQALALAEKHHAPDQQARTHRVLAMAWGRQGDDRQALTHATSALDHYRALDQPVAHAIALNTAGWYAARLGEYDTAHAHCQAALTLHRRHHDTEGEAAALDSLGYIAHRTDRHRQAIAYYGQALTLFQALGNTYHAANTLDNLGHPHLALGEVGVVRAVWQEAIRLYQEQNRDTDAEHLRRRLDALEDTL